VQKSTSAQGIRKYIVDVVGDLPVILLELESLGSNQFEIKKAYIYGNSEILAEYEPQSAQSSQRYYYLHDRLGSVRQVINSSGVVVKMFTFNPFGETLEENGTFYTPWQFTGQYLDSETGQYYLRARQYSPYLARFTGRDLIAADFNEPLTLHRYLYCQNDPIDWIDPSGFDKYLGIEKDKHMWIGVDVWENGKIVGQIKYSFKACPQGWGDFILGNILSVGPGMIRADSFNYDEAKKNGVIKDQKKQSQEEDEKLRKVLEECMKDPPDYGIFWYQCYKFSLKAFYDNNSGYNSPFWGYYMDLMYGEVP
jgi:RHS repeat-associated protein